MKKVALITGITGQDGSYLAELLLEKGYEVHGIVRRVALEDERHRLWRIRKILKDINLHAGSLESYASLFNIILKIKPMEVYHLAAQSYVGYSFEDEFSSLIININGTQYLLSAVRSNQNNIKALAKRLEDFYSEWDKFLDFGKYVGDISTQSSMVRMNVDWPFTRQYIDTPKYWYQISQLTKWGLGPILGALCWIGLIHLLVDSIRRKFQHEIILITYFSP